MRRIAVRDFSLETTMNCGQTFCWIRDGEGYVNPDVDGAIYVEQKGNALYYETSNNNIDLRQLLGLEDPIRTIQQEVNKDTFMSECMKFADGLRVVRDPFFGCLVSFLCSVRNSIPNIKRLTQRIRERFGPRIRLGGKTYFGMPSPKTLAETRPQDLKELGLAWRSEFVIKSAKAIASEEIDENELRKMSYEEAHDALKFLYGVGNKVADCVCLFSLGFLEAFPIDIWIERVIKKHYSIFTQTGNSYRNKSRAAREYFGRYAGYAQEYLYYYTRTRKII